MCTFGTIEPRQCGIFSETTLFTETKTIFTEIHVQYFCQHATTICFLRRGFMGRSRKFRQGEGVRTSLQKLLNQRGPIALSKVVRTSISEESYSHLLFSSEGPDPMPPPSGYAHVTYISQASFCGTSANSAKPDQTLQNTASDQVLHCMRSEVNKNEKYRSTTCQGHWGQK